MLRTKENRNIIFAQASLLIHYADGIRTAIYERDEINLQSYLADLMRVANQIETDIVEQEQ